MRPRSSCPSATEAAAATAATSGAPPAVSASPAPGVQEEQQGPTAGNTGSPTSSPGALVQPSTSVKEGGRPVSTPDDAAAVGLSRTTNESSAPTTEEQASTGSASAITDYLAVNDSCLDPAPPSLVLEQSLIVPTAGGVVDDACSSIGNGADSQTVATRDDEHTALAGSAHGTIESAG